MVDISVRNMSKHFTTGDGTIVAVDEIDLDVADGEFVSLVGPSGCGKTTTMRCIAGLELPTAGTIRFGDRDVTDLAPQKRDVALLFQDIALYPHMTVAENIAYGLKISGVSADERRKRAKEAAERLHISDQLDKSPADLSGGQQQRAALGRSLVRDPEVFLFDEPMSDLDAKLKRELRPVIQRITKNIGCPVIYVTHDQEEAMTLSDRVAVMNEGEIEQIDEPKALYNDPVSDFSAGFIGQPTTQFFAGTAVDGESAISVELDDGSTVETTISSATLDGYVDEPVKLGIRPQHISVGSDGGIPAEHYLDEPLGDVTHSFFETPVGETIAVTDAEFEGNGGTYGLQLAPDHVQLYDPSSGVRIA
ncbi:ABC transporter ATP-binding protein [Halovivax limisalsi]|uniref:ABC transporter ATP-binding protein n=1 Tax=Halovivax limisalsi TaxID=1453760 RepID=UPI001FFD5081|nr:ABC transporter ATP-binding protein [Halovivax limisalsi]